ncbi:MAG TPA: hypothetical protein VG650_13470 [Mycobacteriales bacterium]|nr:hypothetical protein [Mycobacteriales bacterium]
MKRRQPAVVLDGAVLPDELRRFTAADWPGSTAAERSHDEEQAATRSGTAVPELPAVMDQWRRRRQWNNARTAWCAERGMTDERGRIDWHRFRAYALGDQPDPARQH